MSLRSERIKRLVEESNKTYRELEAITGIKRSSLQRYATGLTPKIPLDVIEKLSIAFNVSQEYLMGWDDEEEKSVSPDKLALTEGEQMVLDLFRRVPEEQQRIVLEMIRAALGTRG